MSRVGHLSLDVAHAPEREPIKFDTASVRGAPEEVVQLVENIRDVAEQFLYHWDKFPLVLPAPLHVAPPGDYTSLGRRAQGNLRELFVAPAFDELEAVACDGSGDARRLSSKQLEAIREKGLHKDKFGKPKMLTESQLESIRRWGEFEVDSCNFPGQVHRWRLSRLLQLGVERSRAQLLDHVALALRLLVVTSRDRFVAPFFSLRRASRSAARGLLRLADIVLGVPSLRAQDVEARVREERCRYLVAELVPTDAHQEALRELCSYVRRQLRRARTEKFDAARECCAAVPLSFLTPSGATVDLRLFCRDVMRRAVPVLVAILEQQTRGWFLHFRERLIADLRSKKMPREEIQREVNAAVMREYLDRVYASILASADLAQLGEGVPQLLVEQAQSVVLMHRAIENVQHKLAAMKVEVKERLESERPVMARVQPWLSERLRVAEERFVEESMWSAHQEALALCTKQHLGQTVYFLNRDLAFMREREPMLRQELRKATAPTRVFRWRTQIWRPSRWRVTRSFQGVTEAVATVVTSASTSIVSPRADPAMPVYLVAKETTRTTTTRWPMWRWINYCHRTYSWTLNAIFFFMVVVPWCSPVSLRALFSVEPFPADLELSQVNGTLFPRKSSITATLLSRLDRLWRHISKARTHFEQEPDTGFIGKGLSRHCHRAWNYVGKGLLGTAALVIFFPLVCLVASIGSLLIAATAVLWMPVVALLFHLFSAFVYDLDSPLPDNNRYCVVAEAVLWDILLLGCVQPVAALLVALVLCPLAALLVLAGGMTRFCLRLCWDAAMFHLVIKKRARVPARDSVVVKRVAGPGLTSDYFYQIQAEQALCVLEARIQLDELDAFEKQTESLIQQPLRDYSHFVDAVFRPFSGQLCRSGAAYAGLEKEARDASAALRDKLERRRRDLSTGLAQSVRNKIRLPAPELRTVVQQGALMLERHYPPRVLQRLITTEEEFWESRGLDVNDWCGLAGVMFADIFSPDFLTALDEADTKFRLESSVDLSRYTAMLCGDLGPAGPDLLGPVYAPRGNIQVQSPFLEVSAFNPRCRLNPTAKRGDGSAPRRPVSQDEGAGERSSWRPWKRRGRPYSAEKLVIPLPVPHPAHIAITIHNRDSDDPICLESDVCQSILRGIEDSASPTDMSDVGRYRGGGASADSSADSLDSHSSSPVADWRHMTRRRNNSASVRVELASPEDVTLDTDASRVVFSTAYGTTV